MELSELEQRRIQKAVDGFLKKRRPPPDLRKKLDLGYRLEGQSLTLLEIRPIWNDPSQFMECPMAKATHVKTRKTWRVFWQRADMNWHSYPLSPEVRTVEEFLALVDNDQKGYFWG